MKIKKNLKVARINSSSMSAIVGESNFSRNGFSIRTGVSAGGCIDTSDGCPVGLTESLPGKCNNECNA